MKKTQEDFDRDIKAILETNPIKAAYGAAR